MSHVIWNLLLFHRSLLHIFTSCNSYLTFLTQGESHDFNIKGFLKTIKFIQWHFQMRNFNCTAAEVTEVNFKISSFLVYLLLAQIFFRATGDDQHFHFRFKNAEYKWTAGNFVVYSLEVSLKIISFRHPFRLLVWNFGHPRVNRRCLTNDQAPI